MIPGAPPVRRGRRRLRPTSRRRAVSPNSQPTRPRMPWLSIRATLIDGVSRSGQGWPDRSGHPGCLRLGPSKGMNRQRHAHDLAFVEPWLNACRDKSREPQHVHRWAQIRNDPGRRVAPGPKDREGTDAGVGSWHRGHLLRKGPSLCNPRVGHPHSQRNRRAAVARKTRDRAKSNETSGITSHRPAPSIMMCRAASTR